MASQKLVRCNLRARGAKGEGSARFIPLEIFGLWEYLMTHKHEFEVIAPRASLWLDMEDSPETAYSDQQYERVTEVTAFVYSNRIPWRPINSRSASLDGGVGPLHKASNSTK